MRRLLLLLVFAAAAFAQTHSIPICDQEATPKCVTLTVPATLAANATLVLPLFTAITAVTATYTTSAANFAACAFIPVPSGTFTITLAPSSAQPAAGQCVWVNNYGTGSVTVAPNGQLLNGGTASIVLGPGTAVAPTGAFIVSGGTNYDAQVFGQAITCPTCLTTAGGQTITGTDTFAGLTLLSGSTSIATFTTTAITFNQPVTALNLSVDGGLYGINLNGVLNGSGVSITGCLLTCATSITTVGGVNADNAGGSYPAFSVDGVVVVDHLADVIINTGSELILPAALASQPCLGTNVSSVVIAGTCGDSVNLPLTLSGSTISCPTCLVTGGGQTITGVDVFNATQIIGNGAYLQFWPSGGTGYAYQMQATSANNLGWFNSTGTIVMSLDSTGVCGAGSGFCLDTPTLMILPTAANAPGLILHGNSAQSVDLVDIESYGGSKYFTVGSAGLVSLPLLTSQSCLATNSAGGIIGCAGGGGAYLIVAGGQTVTGIDTFAASLIVESNAVGAASLTINQLSGQTANYLNLYNSSAGLVFDIDASGDVNLPVSGVGNFTAQGSGNGFLASYTPANTTALLSGAKLVLINGSTVNFEADAATGNVKFLGSLTGTMGTNSATMTWAGATLGPSASLLLQSPGAPNTTGSWSSPLQVIVGNLPSIAGPTAASPFDCAPYVAGTLASMIGQLDGCGAFTVNYGIVSVVMGAQGGTAPTAILGQVVANSAFQYTSGAEFNGMCYVTNCMANGAIFGVADNLYNSSSGGYPATTYAAYQIVPMRAYLTTDNTSTQIAVGLIFAGNSLVNAAGGTADGFTYPGAEGIEFRPWGQTIPTKPSGGAGSGGGQMISSAVGIAFDDGSIKGSGYAILIGAAGTGCIGDTVNFNEAHCTSAGSGVMQFQGTNASGTYIPMHLGVTASGLSYVNALAGDFYIGSNTGALSLAYATNLYIGSAISIDSSGDYITTHATASSIQTYGGFNANEAAAYTGAVYSVAGVGVIDQARNGSGFLTVTTSSTAANSYQSGGGYNACALGGSVAFEVNGTTVIDCSRNGSGFASVGINGTTVIDGSRDVAANNLTFVTCSGCGGSGSSSPAYTISLTGGSGSGGVATTNMGSSAPVAGLYRVDAYFAQQGLTSGCSSGPPTFEMYLSWQDGQSSGASAYMLYDFVNTLASQVQLSSLSASGHAFIPLDIRLDGSHIPTWQAVFVSGSCTGSYGSYAVGVTLTKVGN